MKAAMLFGPKDIRIQDITKPEIEGSGEVIINIKACGICPTDLRIYLGLHKLAKYPSTLGHEWVGEIVEAKDVHDFNLGDKVAVAWPEFCYECHYCQSGQFNLCQKRWAHKKVYGGFMEYGRAHCKNIRKIGDNISFQEAIFAEPLACAINGISKANIKIGDFVVVIGDGPLGLIHLQLAKMSGAVEVMVCGHHSNKLHLASQLGADYVVNTKEEDPITKVMEVTHGKKADSAIIAVSSISAIEQGIKMVDRGGKVVIFGGIHPPTEVKIDPNYIHYNEISLIGSIDFTPDMFSKSVELINTRRIHLKPLISHVFHLDKISEGFKVMQERESMKVVVEI